MRAFLSRNQALIFAAIAASATAVPEVSRQAQGAKKEGQRRKILQEAIKADMQAPVDLLLDRILQEKLAMQEAKRAERAARSTKKRKGNK